MPQLIISILPEWEDLTLHSLLSSVFHLGKKTRHELRMSPETSIDDHLNPNFESKLTGKKQIALPYMVKKEITATKNTALQIIYEDKFLIMVNKPAGIKSHPNSSSEIDTLVNHVQYYLNATGQVSARALPVHRLDQTTSGLILFAKNPLALAAMSYRLEERQISRSYIAVIEGIMHTNMRIDKAIGKDRHISGKQHVSSTGKKAITYVTPVANEHKQKLTLIRCKLETGRTHQIRVHLASIGHPILGDHLYGSNQPNDRIMLHAETLQFRHPFLGRTLKFNSPAENFWVE